MLNRNDKFYLGLCLIYSMLIFNGCVDADQIGNLCTDSPVGKTTPGICGCNVSDAPDPKTGIPSCLNKSIDYCPNDPDKTLPGICGCGISDDPDETGVIQCLSEEADYCPDDPKKTLPGICGCGMEDAIDNNTKTYTCISSKIDLCPDDSDKELPGVCGCGVPDTIVEEYGLPKCLVDQIDLCPDDPLKTRPGVCGCGVSDEDLNEYGIPKCKSGDVDYCPTDPNKKVPGLCGCGVKDEGDNLEDPDGDGFANCIDFCDMDPSKQDPGVCGCGIKDEGYNIEDPDGDGYANCVDACPLNKEVHELMDGCPCEREVFRYGRIMCAIRNLDELREAYANQSKSGALKEYFIYGKINLGKQSLWASISELNKPVNFSLYGENSEIESEKLTCNGPQRCSLLGSLGDVTIQGIRFNLKFEMNGNAGSTGTGAIAGTASKSIIKDIKVQTEFISGFDGFENIGGVIGKATSVYFDNVEVESAISGKNNVGGLVGLITSGGSVVNSFVQTSLKASNVDKSAKFGGIAGAIEGSGSVPFNVLNSAAIMQSLNYNSKHESVAGLIGSASGFVYVHNSYAAGQLIPADKVTDLVYFESYKGNPTESYQLVYGQKDWKGEEPRRMQGFDSTKYCFTLENGVLKTETGHALVEELNTNQTSYNDGKNDKDPYYNTWVEAETKIAGTSYKVPRPKKEDSAAQ